MGAQVAKFKKALSHVFDDNLHTKQWHNYVDYLIICFIIISAIEIFISTFHVSERTEKILHIIDLTTQIFFTVEVSLRIWCADLINPCYQGLKGRLRYCCSFFGFIDVLATYPFFISAFFPFTAPLKFLRIFRLLRVSRLFRIFRYMKSFRLLAKAFKSKKMEMFISLQFLLIITVILSFFLYFFEHTENPELIGNAWSSIIWSLSRYISDPGKIADAPLLTPAGHIIAFLIGIIGIAIFAVPAGLIGSGFTEAIEEEKQQIELRCNKDKVLSAFERQADRLLGVQIVPQYVTIGNLQAQLGLTSDEIINVVKCTRNLRLVNLAVTQTLDEHPEDKIVLELFPLNTKYGCCIDRGSKVTIVNTSGIVDPSVTNFSYYLALFGGFNYISRDIGKIYPYKSYYLINSEEDEENLSDFIRDYERLTKDKDSWAITILACSGFQAPSFPTHIHITAGGDKGDETFLSSTLTVKDIDALKNLNERISIVMKDYGYLTDFQKYYSSSSAKVFVRKTSTFDHTNAIFLRIAFKIISWDSRRIAIAKSLADIFHSELEPMRDVVQAEELTLKELGYPKIFNT